MQEDGERETTPFSIDTAAATQTNTSLMAIAASYASPTATHVFIGAADGAPPAAAKTPKVKSNALHRTLPPSLPHSRTLLAHSPCFFPFFFLCNLTTEY